MKCTSVRASGHVADGRRDGRSQGMDYTTGRMVERLFQCDTCGGTGQLPEPEGPPPAGYVEIAGGLIEAPGFDAQTFAAGLSRARTRGTFPMMPCRPGPAWCWWNRPAGPGHATASLAIPAAVQGTPRTVTATTARPRSPPPISTGSISAVMRCSASTPGTRSPRRIASQSWERRRNMAEIQHTPATLQRIETERRERVSRRASQGRHFQVEPDRIVPGVFLVRNPKIPGTVEIVTAAGECELPAVPGMGRLPARGAGGRAPGRHTIGHRAEAVTIAPPPTIGEGTP